MPRCRQIELLSPQQERFLADAAATVPAPFRDDFEADVRDRLGEWPTGGDVCDQCVARLVSGAQGFGGAMNPQLNDDSPLDPNGLLRDGKVLRVRMHALDSNTVRGQIAAANRAAIHDGHHSEFGLYRPGPRHNDAVDRSLCEQAYDAMCRASSEVWKSGPGQQSDASPPANACGSYEERLIGTVCTLSGADGRLEASADGKWLICHPIAQRNDSVPAWHPGLSLADGERIRGEAYLARVRNGEQAWENLGRS